MTENEENMIIEKVISFGVDGYYKVHWDDEKLEYVVKNHLLEEPVTKEEYDEYLNNGDYFP